MHIGDFGLFVRPSLCFLTQICSVLVKRDYQNIPNVCFMKILDTNPLPVICFLNWDRLHAFAYIRTDICDIPLCVGLSYKGETEFSICTGAQWICKLNNSGVERMKKLRFKKKSYLLFKGNMRMRKTYDTMERPVAWHRCWSRNTLIRLIP
jgi:hypothetical protein